MGKRVTDFEPLPTEFYLQPTVEAARQLLGKYLIRFTESGFEGGRIVETEAYTHDDPASHSFRGQTPRNDVMFGEPGVSYVYRSYGVHWCLNAVCQPKGIGDAVLIRAIEPLWGLNAMRQRRGVEQTIALCKGPGNLCRALGIDGSFNGQRFTDHLLFIAEGDEVLPCQIIATDRIGISQAVDFPWRFFINDNPYVSARKR